MLISDLPDDDGLELVVYSQDVREIKSHLGKVAKEFDAFFVRVGDGDYDEVYGFYGSVPYLDKECFKLI